MEIRLLGPVGVWAAGQTVDIGGPLQRGVLAALAVDVGRLVPVDTVVNRVWGDAAPERARHALQVYITRIRHILSDLSEDDDAGAVLYRSGGYLLDIDADLVDWHRFRRLVGTARERTGSITEHAQLLRDAIDLWQGTALAAMKGDWAARTRQSWHRQRLEATQLWAEAELRLGRPNVVLGPLRDLLDENPFVESLVAVLLRALAYGSRHAEAVDVYATTRARLVDELGVEPGPELQQVHLAILRGQVPPTLSTIRLVGGADREPAQVPANLNGDALRADEPSRRDVIVDRSNTQVHAFRPRPAQLPLGVLGFVGREKQLAALDNLLTVAVDGAATAECVVLTGLPGVGKTSLALHWAHRIADRFPDGQLYVNLRGFDPADIPVPPAQALRTLLDALGVPPDRVPAELDARSNLYRSVLAQHHVLVLLDNARDPGQVRPLLPGGSGCLTVVTSRDQMSGLVAIEGAHTVTVDLLSEADSRRMLTRRLGPRPLEADPSSTRHVLAACAGLPLALAVVAARAGSGDAGSLAAVAGELRDGVDSLDALRDPADPLCDVRGVFSWSYRTLRPATARLFRLLAVHPGPDLTAQAAASLAAVAPPAVRPALVELTGTGLLVQQVPGRYSLHDLVRAYAGEQADRIDSAGERRDTLTNTLDHYLHTAYSAALLLEPNRDRITLAPARPEVTTEPLPDATAAMDWFTAEHAVLVNLVRLAAAHGFDVHVWQLAWTLWTYFERRGHREDWVLVQRAAVAATQRLGDVAAQAFAHRGLAAATAMLGKHAEAEEHFGRALDLLVQLDDKSGQGRTYLNLAWLCDLQGRAADALERAECALELLRASGHVVALANALNLAGDFHDQLGHHQQAVDLCQQALAQHRDNHDRKGEAHTWHTLGRAHVALKDLAAATVCYWHALELFRELGDRYAEADTLLALGDLHDANGDHTAARLAWRESLAILEQLGDTDTRPVLARLAVPAITSTGGSPSLAN